MAPHKEMEIFFLFEKIFHENQIKFHFLYNEIEELTKKKKKFKKTLETPLPVRPQHKSPPIYRFLDPYQNYHLFGDIVLPNKIWQSPNETIYPLDLIRNYKIITQIT